MYFKLHLWQTYMDAVSVSFEVAGQPSNDIHVTFYSWYINTRKRINQQEVTLQLCTFAWTNYYTRIHINYTLYTPFKQHYMGCKSTILALLPQFLRKAPQYALLQLEQ